MTERIVYLTGATGGIGGAISQELANRGGYRICSLTSRLENLPDLEAEILSLLKTHPPSVLIHAAGYGVFRPHEELKPQEIQKMVTVNLTAPMVLDGLCIRALRENRGHIIHLSSIEATRSSKWSALYSATKAGLRSFNHCLHEDLRKSGVAVTCINPDLTRTGFFDDLEFQPTADPDSAIDPQEIAQLVASILENRAVISDITLRPRRLGIEKK
jgi:short-subunit dehydrogenase